ncbi:MAG: hypothetical protein RL193_16 [Actinomycetota bacterium]|jgi:glutamate-1-semialdehyde aminotransferase
MKYFGESQKHLARTEKLIPLASQTFSKSRTQYPVGISPLFVDRAKGAFFWDIDGNKYVDMVNALASVTIGHSDEELNSTITDQLARGTNFSLPGKLEYEVASLVNFHMPSIEKMRFGKNGTDATSAAIRLARAYTGKDYIAVCGYHGWQDWYIASTTRNKGIPNAIRDLTVKFSFNDIESLYDSFESCGGNLAAVIMEPMNVEYPKDNFLRKVQEFCNHNSVIFVLDETISGFRFNAGGAQKEFDIHPDLTTLGKGIANGFPISVIGGKSEILDEMEEIFFSGTFGGEMISLTAAKYVLELFKKVDVSAKLAEIGNKICSEVSEIVKDLDLNSVMSISGHPTWKFYNWQDSENNTSWELKTLFMQEIFQESVFVAATHNVSLAMDEEVQAIINSSYRSALQRVAKSVKQNSVKDDLKVPPLKPLFKVR